MGLLRSSFASCLLLRGDECTGFGGVVVGFTCIDGAELKRERCSLGADLVRTWYGLGTDLVRRRGKAISVGNAERAGSERKTKSVGSVGKCRKV